MNAACPICFWAYMNITKRCSRLTQRSRRRKIPPKTDRIKPARDLLKTSPFGSDGRMFFLSSLEEKNTKNELENGPNFRNVTLASFFCFHIERGRVTHERLSLLVSNRGLLAASAHIISRVRTHLLKHGSFIMRKTSETRIARSRVPN